MLPSRGGDEDPADADVVVEGELGDEMARVLDLPTVVRYFVEHDQDVDVGLGGRLSASEGAEEIDASETLAIEVLEAAA
jgi:hypothetical protein